MELNSDWGNSLSACLWLLKPKDRERSIAANWTGTVPSVSTMPPRSSFLQLHSSLLLEQPVWYRMIDVTSTCLRNSDPSGWLTSCRVREVFNAASSIINPPLSCSTPPTLISHTPSLFLPTPAWMLGADGWGSPVISQQFSNIRGLRGRECRKFQGLCSRLLMMHGLLPEKGLCL